MKKGILITLIVVVGLLGSCAVCAIVTSPKSSTSTNQPIPAPVTPAESPKPETKYSFNEPTLLIGSWTGSTNKNTQTFSVKEPWRIDWQYNGDGYFGIKAIEQGSSNYELIANFSGKPGSDKSYIHKSGIYYLQIDTTNGNWSIKVYSSL